MILVWLIIVPSVGALLALLAERWHPAGPRWAALAALAANLALALVLWAQLIGRPAGVAQGQWLAQLKLPWLPGLGISFYLGLDGLSLVLVALTAFLGLLAVAASWREVGERVGLFHFNLLWVLAGITGVFLALDLFLFAFFWELMLVPAYFLFLWGQERSLAAATKLLIFTQAGGLLMLVAIVGLAFLAGQGRGGPTFDYTELVVAPVQGAAALWLMLGFLAAFAVKLPVVPLHSWLPDAYALSPTAGTVVLAGLMAKTAGYGLIRFVVPLFPEAARAFAPIGMALAAVSILYGAWLAFAQTDLKRLIAYSSLSHMGFVMLGVFAWNEWALQGAVMVMVAHAVSTGALFILAGWLEERTRTRELARLGGLWTTTPRLGGVMLFFALASLGLPGLGNFVGEFLTLLGAFLAEPALAAVAAVGVVFATVYALWLIQRTFQGPNEVGWQLPDLRLREAAVAATLVTALLWLGLFPQPILDATRQTLANLPTLQAEVALPPTQAASGELAGAAPPAGEVGGR